MKTAIVFDIDSTLTPPRQPLNKQMTDVLNRLRVPFFVAAGSDMLLLKEQFFNPLYAFGFRKCFDAFISNGAIQYQCDYSSGMSINKVSEFNIRNYLGETDYCYLLDVLTETLEMEKFQLPSSVKPLDNRLVDRVSMINLCPIGRMEQENAVGVENRKNFASFDNTNKFRDKILIYLNQKLFSLINEKQLKITLGGQTSFDIGILGQDKTKPIRILLEKGFEKVIFIGDALFEGGNDAAINDYIWSWPLNTHCPVEAKKTHSWQETIGFIHELEFIELNTLEKTADEV